jgi:integrase
LVHSILVIRRALGREGEHVFYGYGKTGHTQAFGYALAQIAAKTGIQVSPHDLRRTFASIAATCTIPPIALKMLIAHSTGGDVTAGYTILTPQQFRDAAQTVADRIKELCQIDMVTGENVRVFG